MNTGTLAPVSNKADWIDVYQLIDDEDDDELVDISTATEITVSIRDQECSTPRLTATLTGGEIEHVEAGTFQWTFTKDQMGGLIPKRTYEIGCTILKDDITTQLLIGFLPVVDGIVA